MKGEDDGPSSCSTQDRGMNSYHDEDVLSCGSELVNTAHTGVKPFT